MASVDGVDIKDMFVVKEICVCFFIIIIIYFLKQNRLIVSYRRFGETYRSHHNQSLIEIKA